MQYQCNYHSECGQSEACFDHKCVNPCSLPNVCGRNAECSSFNHTAICTCKPGGTGDPNFGCTPVQYCKADHQCSAGSTCNNGICIALCASSRECIGEQLCIKGACQPTCRSNLTCPEYQFCSNNICVQEFRCTSDNDCLDDERCVKNNVGQAQCVKACSLLLCSRNAQCKAKNHVASCTCRAGYFGDVTNDKIGCQRIECSSHNECSEEKICDMHRCRIACLAFNPCGHNAICSTKNHKQVCSCQPGYTGDPTVGCNLVDHCLMGPCAPGAMCENTRGSFKCYCQKNTIGDPYNSGCYQPSECKLHSDCPPSAKCVRENGISKCHGKFNIRFFTLFHNLFPKILI